MFKTKFGKNIYSSVEYKRFFEQEDLETLIQHVHDDMDHVNDTLLVVYLLLTRNKELTDAASSSRNDNTPEINKHLTRILAIWLWLYANEVNFRRYLLDKSVDLLFVRPQHWRELIHLCDTAYKLDLNDVYTFLIELFSSRLMLDLSLHDSKKYAVPLLPLLVSSKCMLDEEFKLVS